MNNYISQWFFTENGSAYDLTKLVSITKYQTLVATPATEYVIILDKGEVLIPEKEALEIIQALKNRELQIEKLVNANTGIGVNEDD